MASRAHRCTSTSTCYMNTRTHSFKFYKNQSGMKTTDQGPSCLRRRGGLRIQGHLVPPALVKNKQQLGDKRLGPVWALCPVTWLPKRKHPLAIVIIHLLPWRSLQHARDAILQITAAPTCARATSSPCRGQGLLDLCRVFAGDGTFAIVDAGVH